MKRTLAKVGLHGTLPTSQKLRTKEKMTRIIRAAVMAVCLVAVPGIAPADTLVLRDGTRIDGTAASFTARTLTFVHGDGVSRRYATSEIASLEFLSAERANPRAPRSSLAAPAGAQFIVQAIEIIDSRNAGADQTYAAIFQQSVMDMEHRVVVPKGASAQLILRHLSNANERGGSELAIDLRSIAIDGQKYLVNSWEPSDAEPAVVDLEPVEAGDAVDVDQMTRPRQAERHC